MIDSVLKGTGNSRLLKSAVPAGTSWADALAMLQAGTFPIDFNGINTEGFQQVGTPLNKANLLKDATAAQIGLPPSTTPDGMFQALGNTGELHVWRKTVVSSSEQPAGYTLGDVIENSEIWVENRYADAVFHYATSISVSDTGLVSLVGEKTATIGHSNNGENIAEFDVFKGKFVYISGGDNNKRQFIFYIPANATFHRDGNYSTNKIYADKEQRVNAHGIIPPGTTTTYPVSTNPNAYQEGDDAKEAEYVVGEVVSGQFSLGVTVDSSAINRYNYSSAITVNDAGVVSLSNSTPIEINGGNSAQNNDAMAKIVGKYISLERVGDSNHPPDFDAGVVWFIPADATYGNKGSYPNNINYVTKRQLVTGYAAIPAGTTIEYLGKLGDKARVQVVSYVGTGTYGSSNPNSLTFGFVPKVVFIVSAPFQSNYCISAVIIPDTGMFAVIRTSTVGYESRVAGGSCIVVRNGKIITWYSGDTTIQLNESGLKFTAVAIG